MLHTFNKKTEHGPQILFVASAVCKPKDGRSLEMERIYSDGKRVIATDRHRAHIYNAEALPAGLYTIIKKTKSEILLSLHDEDLQYLDVDRVVPERDSQDFKFQGEAAAYAQVLRAMPKNCLNYHYFEDVFPFVNSFTPGDGESPVRFDGENITAVIMPYKMLEETK